MIEKLSSTTLRVFDAISEWFKSHHYPPTLRELAQALRFSSTWPVRYHINKLIEAGYIKMDKKVSRGIGLLKKSAGIPILGRVSAGLPAEALENNEGYLDLSNMFDKSDDLFALKVKGDSMKDEGIFEGDIAFVRKQQVASDGSVVVALIDNEALIKKFYFTLQGIRLEPANPKYQPIISKDVAILGKVIAVFRKYKK